MGSSGRAWLMVFLLQANAMFFLFISKRNGQLMDFFFFSSQSAVIKPNVIEYNIS